MAGPRRESPEVTPPDDYVFEEVVLWSTIDNLVRTVALNMDVEVAGMPPVVAHTVLEDRLIHGRCTIEELLQRCLPHEQVIYITILENLHGDIIILKLLYQGAQICVPMIPYVLLGEDSSISASSAPTSPAEQALLDESFSAPSSNSTSPRAQALQSAKGTASIAELSSNEPIYQNVEFPRNEIRLEVLLEDLILPATIAQQSHASARAALKHKLSKMKKEPCPKVPTLDNNNEKNKIAVLRDIVDNLMRVIALLTDFVLTGLPPLKRSEGELVYQHRWFSSGEGMRRLPKITAAQIFISQHRASIADHLLMDKSMESTNFKNVIACLHQDVKAMYSLYYFQSTEHRNVYHARASRTKDDCKKLIHFVTKRWRFPL